MLPAIGVLGTLALHGTMHMGIMAAKAYGARFIWQQLSTIKQRYDAIPANNDIASYRNAVTLYGGVACACAIVYVGFSLYSSGTSLSYLYSATSSCYENDLFYKIINDGFEHLSDYTLKSAGWLIASWGLVICAQSSFEAIRKANDSNKLPDQSSSKEPENKRSMTIGDLRQRGQNKNSSMGNPDSGDAKQGAGARLRDRPGGNRLGSANDPAPANGR